MILLSGKEMRDLLPLTIPRGIRLAHVKEPAASRGIESLKSIEKVQIPLAYGDSRVCRPAMGAYETVMRGEAVGLPDDPADTPAVATVSGVFSNLRSLHHPLFGELNCAVVQCMVSTGEEPSKPRPVENMKTEEILTAARKAGIIDELDGIPLHQKLQEWREAGCSLIVVNAVEAEPFASSAWAVLNESAEEIQKGLLLAVRAAGASGSHFAVRLPATRRRPLSQRLGAGQVYQVSGRYPVERYSRSGAPVALIGPQACLALYRAAAYGEGQCDGVLTVAGDAVATPKNIRVPFGTSVEDVLAYCGLSADPTYVILGDAITGVTTQVLDIPVLPGMTCLLALKARQVIPARACIGCGRCAQVCHAGLLPYEIVRRLENMHYERLPSLQPEECDGCGACSYVCPAGREVAARVAEAAQARGPIFLNWGDDDES